MAVKVDVLVVGAGPAGSLAARAAASAGAAVLLIDKKTRAGALPHCAEFAPRALALELDFPRRSRVQAVEGLDLHFQGRVYPSPSPGWILDRQVFDHDLAVDAARAGAEIMVETSLCGREDGLWVLEQRGTRLTIQAGSVVGADGASSRTARLAGRPPQPLMPAVQVEVLLKKSLERTMVFLAPEYRLGYAWLFPKGDTANVGLGGQTPESLGRLLDDFCRRLRQADLIGPGILARTGGGLPLGGARTPVAQDGIFLAGDAAGLTHPVTGAGIPQAVFSGSVAGAEAAARAGGDLEAEQRYEKEIIGRYGRFLERGLAARREMDESWDEKLGLALERAWPAVGRAGTGS